MPTIRVKHFMLVNARKFANRLKGIKIRDKEALSKYGKDYRKFIEEHPEVDEERFSEMVISQLRKTKGEKE